MDKEDLAKDVYYDLFCGERIAGVSFLWDVADSNIKDKCREVADYILENFEPKKQGATASLLIQESQLCSKEQLQNMLKNNVLPISAKRQE